MGRVTSNADCAPSGRRRLASGQPDSLALRMVIASCSTCNLDLYAANAIVRWLPGVLDGASIPRAIKAKHYELATDRHISSSQCKSIAASTSVRTSHLSVRGEHRRSKTASSKSWKPPEMALDLYPVTSINRFDIPQQRAAIDQEKVTDTICSPERLITSPCCVLFLGQKRDLSNSHWVSERFAPPDRLTIVTWEERRQKSWWSMTR